MQRPSKWITLINIFGTLGYLSVLMQWAWSFLIAIYPLLISKPALLFPDVIPDKSSHFVEPSTFWTPIVLVTAVTITLIVVAITVIIIVRMPKSIGKQAARMTHSTAQAIAPAFIGQTKVSKKKQRKLSYQIVVALKVLLVIIPLVVLFFAGSIAQVSDHIVWVAAAFCAGCSVVYFAVQLLIVKLARVDTTMVW